MRAFFVLIMLSSVSLSAKLPEGTRTCHKSDPNFDVCLRDAMTDGMKRFARGYKPLGVPVLDPIAITELTSDNGGFKQTYKDVKISALGDTKCTNLKIDWDKLEIDIETLTTHSVLSADYSFKGQLLTFPIDSAGKCQIVMDDVTSLHHLTLERFQKNGKNYLRVLTWKLQNKPKAVHYDFENLVPGNEQLSKTILKTLNDNAIEIFAELGSTFEEAYGEVHKSVANKVFEKIPENDIFLP
ncbi:protein takeout-like [Coccinella septempunctata]|uniref:protein takeout-like n=1 Tax=Coccinella septempunctata TaxID=41139 RepID=UPI001D0756B8|nr:protein takeout-like [Coccinella septempunctata]